MSYVRLSRDQQLAICEDLLAIDQAGRLPEVWAVRRQMLRNYCPASPWEQVGADRIAREASNICGGSLAQWREAAASAMGFTYRAAFGIDAICRVADDVRWSESQRAALPAHMSIGSRKRGGR